MDVMGTRKTYLGTIPPLSIASLIDVQLGIWKIDALAKTVPKGRYVKVLHWRDYINARMQPGHRTALTQRSGIQ